MAIIAVAGRKGGIGKSTIAGNLAGEFSDMGRSVVLLDADPQHSLVAWAAQGEGLLAIGRRKLLIATLINAIFPGVAVAFAIGFWNRPKPEFVTSYWVIYCAVTLASAIFMWWVPYFMGATEKTRQEYLMMYEGTRQVLRRRKDNPRPNLLHLCFHALFVVTFCLALAVRLRSA